MKKFLFISVLACLAGMSFVSCSKDDDEEEKKEDPQVIKTRCALFDFVVNDTLLLFTDVSFVVYEGKDSTVYASDDLFEKYSLGKDTLSLETEKAIIFNDGSAKADGKLPSKSGIENRLYRCHIVHKAKSAGQVSVKIVATVKKDLKYEDEDIVNLLVGKLITYAIDNPSKPAFSGFSEVTYHKGIYMKKLDAFYKIMFKNNMTITIP